MQTIYTPDELAEVIELTEEPTRFTTLEEVRGMALEPGREAVTLNRQGFYQVVTADDFWKAVERLGL